jgi:mono/diheme cytochrome c family protein
LGRAYAFSKFCTQEEIVGKLHRFGIAGLLMTVAVAPAAAVGNADAARGIVAEYCASCHVVPGYKARFERAELNAPDFQAMADQPDLFTTERLTAFLGRPHYPMAKFILSTSDVDNLVAFIEALRKP